MDFSFCHSAICYDAGIVLPIQNLYDLSCIAVVQEKIKILTLVITRFRLRISEFGRFVLRNLLEIGQVWDYGFLICHLRFCNFSKIKKCHMTLKDDTLLLCLSCRY